MKCYRKIPHKEPITKKGLLAVALSTAIWGAAIVAPLSFFAEKVSAEALPDVTGTAATTVAQYLYSVFAASGNSLANHEVNTAMMTELSITMQDLAEEGIITLQGQVYDPNNQEQINEVIQAFGQRTGDVEVNVAQFAQRIQALDSIQTERLEQAAFSLDKLETDPNLSYPDYFVYFSYALQGFLEAGMIEGAKLYEIAMDASDNVILTLDDIHDSVIQFYSDLIDAGAPVDAMNQAPSANDIVGYTYKGGLKLYGNNWNPASFEFYLSNDDCILIYYPTQVSFIRYPQNASSAYKQFGTDGSFQRGGYDPGGSPIARIDSWGYPYVDLWGIMQFPSAAAAEAYAQGLYNGTINPPTYHSPDLINQSDGNLSKSNKNGTAPAINADEGLLPIPTADIAPFEQAVADNNAQQLYPDNADEAELLINPYIVPNTAPGPAPEPGYNPIPDQPTIPEKDPITSEQEQKNLGGATQGLEDIFPFCIPFDIGKVFTAFTANRKAPYIKCPIDPWGDYIELDFSVFDEAAALLRLLELILFIVGLALAARSLIGAGG